MDDERKIFLIRPTDPLGPSSPGEVVRSRQDIIDDQDRQHAGMDDAALYLRARDLFDECASKLQYAINRMDGGKRAINDVYVLSGAARIALEVLARRWMKTSDGA